MVLTIAVKVQFSVSRLTFLLVRTSKYDLIKFVVNIHEALVKFSLTVRNHSFLCDYRKIVLLLYHYLSL